jgi:hypothetical protein
MARQPRLRATLSRASFGIAAALAYVAVVGVAPVSAAMPPDVEVRVVDATGGRLGGAAVALAFAEQGAAQRSLGRITTSDAKGIARWPLALSDSEQRAVDVNGGWLNVHAYVLNQVGDPVSTVSFSKYLGTDAEYVARQALRPAATTLRVDPRQLLGTVRKGAIKKGVIYRPQDIGECWSTYWELVDVMDKNTTVGEMHIASDTPTYKFTYGKSADSDIDVGVKQSFGGWTISGSAHVGNSQTDADGTTQHGPYYRGFMTEFRYERWQLFSDCTTGNHIYRGSDEVDPAEWRGGFTPGCCSISFYDNNRQTCCDLHYGPGGFMDRSSNDFKKLSAAVSVFGVTLGAQSGSSTNVKIHYDFGQNAHHYLYGLTQLPSAAGMVYASNT